MEIITWLMILTILIVSYVNSLHIGYVEIFKAICLIFLLLVGINTITAFVNHLNKPSSEYKQIYEFIGPGPINNFISSSRKRERDGCSTSGNFNDPCMLD